MDPGEAEREQAGFSVCTPPDQAPTTGCCGALPGIPALGVRAPDHWEVKQMEQSFLGWEVEHSLLILPSSILSENSASEKQTSPLWASVASWGTWDPDFHSSRLKGAASDWDGLPGA